MKTFCALASGLVVALSAAAAFATDAGVLFDEGVKLLDAGRVTEACPKLEQSQRLEPAAGTLLNLAACYEKSDRRVLALATFREASRAAAARGRADWKKVADEHVAALDAALPKLTIHKGTTPAVRVSLDGALLAPTSFEVPIAVEPGAHVIVAEAPERARYTAPLVVRTATSVTVPLLDIAPRADARATESPPPKIADDALRPRTVGLVVGGVGVAGLAFGAVGTVVAANALSDAKAACPSYPDRCSQAADAPNERARTWSMVSTVGFVAGGALLATGAVLYFWPNRATKVSVAGSGLVVAGTF